MRSLKERFSPAAPYAMLPVRLALFATFFYHGTQMLFGLFDGPGLEGTKEMFIEMGFPVPKVFAFLLAIVETLGSIAFLVGAGVRFFGLLLIGLMIGGMVRVHGANGWGVTSGGIEFNVAIIAMILAVMLRGPGHGSIEWADEEGAAPGAVS